VPVSPFVNPLAPRQSRILAKSAEVKAWVRNLLDLPEDTPVSVIELACRDEGCPDIETVIGVMEPGKPIRTFRVHAALADTDHASIANVLGVRAAS
jgi:hypothetical protein